MFRPLRHAAPLGKVVASLGLALYLQGVALLNFGTSYPTPKSVYPNPNSAFENFLGLGSPFPRNSLFAFFAAVILGAVVWAVYKFTRFGMATRAAASNEKGAVLLGYSPQRLAADELGRRVDARHAGRHPRRPDPGADHAGRADRADRARRSPPP